ncbi:MAG TPA: caspase family protein [Polyangia bacterium]|jgi:hypothetical protein
MRNALMLCVVWLVTGCPVDYRDSGAKMQVQYQTAPAMQRSAPPGASAPAGRAPARGEASDVDTPSYRLKERPHDFALVIGVERYASLPAAEFAEQDAAAVTRHLHALGVPARNVIHLSGQQATRSSIQGYLDEWLPRNVTPGSTVFFYYSGHGAPDPRTGDAYLVPWDGNASFLQSTALPLKHLYGALAKLKATRTIVVLDACFSGAGGRSVLAQGARPLVVTVQGGTLPEGNLTLFAAASGDEITATLRDHGHGLFTYFFLKGLAGAARDQGGRVTARSLHEYLKPRVQDEARRQNREQTPNLHAPQELVIRGE